MNDGLSPSGEIVLRSDLDLRFQREEAYARALRAAGYTNGSVQIMLARDRYWLDWGENKPDDKA